MNIHANKKHILVALDTGHVVKSGNDAVALLKSAEDMVVSGVVREYALYSKVTTIGSKRIPILTLVDGE